MEVDEGVIGFRNNFPDNFFETGWWQISIDDPMSKNQYRLFQRLDEFDYFLPVLCINREQGCSWLMVIAYRRNPMDEQENKNCVDKIRELQNECDFNVDFECLFAAVSKESLRSMYRFTFPHQLKEGRRDNKQNFNI